MARPNLKSARSSSKPKNIKLIRPKLVKLRLDQIIPYTIDPKFEWVRNLHHLPESSPTLVSETVALLTICQPLVVTRNRQTGTNSSRTKTDTGSAAKPTFRLLAGFRTFQLLMEGTMSSKVRTWALEIPEPLENGIAHAVFDSITTKLLLSPNSADLALIGAVNLDQKEIRQELGRQLVTDTNDQLAAQLGMSTPSFYRVTAPVCKARREALRHRESVEKVGLEIELAAEAKPNA